MVGVEGEHSMPLAPERTNERKLPLLEDTVNGSDLLLPITF